MALCVEAGGRLNEQFLKLIDYFASISGSTEAERRAFTIFALQRTHLASQRGVAQLIRAQEPMPDGPCFLPPRGLLDLGILPRGSLMQVTAKKKMKAQPPSGEMTPKVLCPHNQSRIYLLPFLLYIPRPWLVQPGPLDLRFEYACGGPLLPVYR